MAAQMAANPISDGHESHISDGRARFGRALEAKPERVGALPRAVPRVARQPLAPFGDSKAFVGGVVGVPFDDQLLEVARAHQPHIPRGVRLEQAKEDV